MRRTKTIGLALVIATLGLAACPGDEEPGPGAGVGGLPRRVNQAISEGDPNPPTKSLTLGNPGSCELGYQASVVTSNGGAWLAVSPTAGTVAVGGSTSLTLSFDVVSPGLLAGTYTGTLTVRGTCTASGDPAVGSPALVAVNLTVTPLEAILAVGETAVEQDVVTLQDTWVTMSAFGAPTPRVGHTAVWTGREVIFWGGNSGSTGGEYYRSGGRYRPATDEWNTTNETLAPIARYGHTAVWTGTEMIVWGGYDSGVAALASGGRYDPQSDTWTSTSVAGAPAARTAHSATWTGTEMVVWGGYDGGMALNSGGRYRPETDTWVSMSSTGAPSPRMNHVAVWTGSLLLVWGGSDAMLQMPSEGGLYDPVTDTWTSMAPQPQPSVDSASHAEGVWTGAVFLAHDWTIRGSANIFAYDPGKNRWATLPPDPYFEWVQADMGLIWTGSRMLVFGGRGNSVYDPATRHWSAMSSGPGGHFPVVWTGTEAVVWSGWADGFSVLQTGARYR